MPSVLLEESPDLKENARQIMNLLKNKEPVKLTSWVKKKKNMRISSRKHTHIILIPLNPTFI